MKSKILFFFFAVLLACEAPVKDPSAFFSSKEQNHIILQSVRFSAKLPPASTHENKFDNQFDWYYQRAAQETDFRKCAIKGDGSYFFLMTRKARSIWPAREAIGGYFQLDSNKNIIDYYEEFRTWKMAEDSLKTRAIELFELMVKGKDLTPYRSKFKGDRYIEFPDDRYYFNREKKRWSDLYFDSLKRQ